MTKQSPQNKLFTWKLASYDRRGSNLRQNHADQGGGSKSATVHTIQRSAHRDPMTNYVYHEHPNLLASLDSGSQIRGSMIVRPQPLKRARFLTINCSITVS